METHRRGSVGRRIFTPGFSHEHIDPVVRLKRLTLATLARELAVSPSITPAYDAHA